MDILHHSIKLLWRIEFVRAGGNFIYSGAILERRTDVYFDVQNSKFWMLL